jgi:hypothetical protein
MCPRCGIEGRIQKRAFSDQALAALVVWEELDREQVGEAICQDCYVELRDILIDRSEELGKIDIKDLERAS